MLAGSEEGLSTTDKGVKQRSFGGTKCRLVAAFQLKYTCVKKEADAFANRP